MKKYIRLILCCSLLLTACGKETTVQKANSTNSNSIQETITTTATESIATKTVTEVVTEAAAVEQSSENSNMFMQGLKWNDDVDTVKSDMQEYILSFEESYEDETTGDKITCLCYMDIELYNEKCDISFELCNSKLSKISYSYIWDETKTKSFEDWCGIFSDTYGEPSSMESAGMFSCYTWENIDNSSSLELSSSKYGVDIRITPIDTELNAQADNENETDKTTNNDTFDDVIIGENGMPCFNITVEEFISKFNSITDFDEPLDFSDLIHEQVYSAEMNSEDVYYISLFHEYSYMKDTPILNLAIYVNKDLYIQLVKMEICHSYYVNFNEDYETIFEAMDIALNKDVTSKDAEYNYAQAYENIGKYLANSSEPFVKVYKLCEITQYNNAEAGTTLFNQPDNTHDYYQYTIFAADRE